MCALGVIYIQELKTIQPFPRLHPHYSVEYNVTMHFVRHVSDDMLHLPLISTTWRGKNAISNSIQRVQNTIIWHFRTVYQTIEDQYNAETEVALHLTNGNMLLQTYADVAVAALKVCVIMLFFETSVTSTLRLLSTASSVWTTLLKLLAAPFSCVKRAMLSCRRVPCSTTVMISAAKATSFKFRSGGG